MPWYDEPLECHRLHAREVGSALDAIREDGEYGELLGANGDGFRAIAAEPERHNKRLYTIPDHNGRDRLVGLSKRFCPFTDRYYVGATLYHALDSTLRDQLIPTLQRAARDLFEAKGDEPPINVYLRCIAGSLKPERIPLLSDWIDTKSWQLMTRAVEPHQVEEARGRIPTGRSAEPRWQGTDGNQVDLADSSHAESVFQMQHCLDHELGLGLDRRRTRSGILSVCAVRDRGGLEQLFGYGGFLVSRRGDALEGCVWCYRSYDPMRACWTVWLRRPYVLPGRRSRGVSRSLYEAAVGYFAHFGFAPSRLRIWVHDSRAVPRLKEEGFQSANGRLLTEVA